MSDETTTQSITRRAVRHGRDPRTRHIMWVLVAIMLCFAVATLVFGVMGYLDVQRETQRSADTATRAVQVAEEARSDAATSREGAEALAKQVERLGGNPVVDPEDLPGPGVSEPLPPANIPFSAVRAAVNQTLPSALAAACDGSCEAPPAEDGIDGQNATNAQVASAVAAYCSQPDQPCRGPAGSDGTDGADGSEGPPGPPGPAAPAIVSITCESAWTPTRITITLDDGTSVSGECVLLEPVDPPTDPEPEPEPVE